VTINEKRFIYAGQTSDAYNVILCSIGTQNTSTNDETSEIISTKTPFKKKWDFHHLEYTTSLQFTMTIAKPDGTYFDSREQRNIKKWLCKSNYNWLQIDQDDLGEVYYYCIITNPHPVDVGMMNAGFEFQINCNSICAWSDLKQISYAVTNTINFDVYNDFDYEDYILYPTLTITPNIAGNIKIINNTTSQIVSINNCNINETIVMDCDNDKIISSSGRVLINDWNIEFLEITNGVNNITIEGNCTILMEYRLPIRVGG
jgi:hypothetical protein